MSDAKLLADATELLYREADLLDQANLDDWVNLYTETGSYWMPVTPEQVDPINHISLFYDDRTIMEIRRRNLRHPRAASKEMPIRSSHVIGNIRFLEPTADPDKMIIGANFHCVVYCDNQQQLFAGRYRYELGLLDGAWLIHQKRVDLINCDANLGAILIYL